MSLKIIEVPPTTVQDLNKLKGKLFGWFKDTSCENNEEMIKKCKKFSKVAEKASKLEIEFSLCPTIYKRSNIKNANTIFVFEDGMIKWSFLNPSDKMILTTVRYVYHNLSESEFSKIEKEEKESRKGISLPETPKDSASGSSSSSVRPKIPVSKTKSEGFLKSSRGFEVSAGLSKTFTTKLTIDEPFKTDKTEQKLHKKLVKSKTCSLIPEIKSKEHQASSSSKDKHSKDDQHVYGNVDYEESPPIPPRNRDAHLTYMEGSPITKKHKDKKK